MCRVHLFGAAKNVFKKTSNKLMILSRDENGRKCHFRSDVPASASTSKSQLMPPLSPLSPPPSQVIPQSLASHSAPSGGRTWLEDLLSYPVTEGLVCWEHHQCWILQTMKLTGWYLSLTRGHRSQSSISICVNTTDPLVSSNMAGWKIPSE